MENQHNKCEEFSNEFIEIMKATRDISTFVNQYFKEPRTVEQATEVYHKLSSQVNSLKNFTKTILNLAESAKIIEKSYPKTDEQLRDLFIQIQENK